MTSRERSRKRDLYRLMVARSDIMAALRACDLALKQVKTLKDEIYFPLHDSIIINYSKPFSSNKPFGPLPKKWNQFSQSDVQELHWNILDLRDTVVAHSDLQARTVTIHFRDPIPGMPGYLINGVSVTRPTTPISELSNIRRLCMDLSGRLDLEGNTLLSELFDFSITESKTIELTFD